MGEANEGRDLEPRPPWREPVDRLRAATTIDPLPRRSTPAQARIYLAIAENRLAPDIVHQLGLEPPPRIEENTTVARLAS